jgi:hypothetical protein
MGKTKSFAPKQFFEQWLPRLIALSVFAYLIYSLVFRQDEFSWLHITLLLIVIVLILAPMASRLKVLNLIDFTSKLNSLEREQQETKSQLIELSNQISSVVSMRVNPIQIMTTGSADTLKELKELFQSFRESESEVHRTVSIEEDAKYTKEEFLRRAYGYRSKAYTLLLLTMVFQVAIREHRASTSADYVEGSTMSEKIPNMIKKVLANGLDTVFPIMVTDEKSGESRSVITPGIIEKLQLINSLIELCEKIESGESELPPRADIDSLFDSIGEALATIGAGLEVIGTYSILYQYRMTNAIEALEREIRQADTEQRPIHFPPPKSD